MATPPIRRQVYELSASDLVQHPLWEFCSDEEDVEGQDEATVRPSEEAEVLGYSPGAYIVAADVTFRDGTTGSGYLYSGEPEDYGCIQPNIFSNAAQVNFWLGSLSFISDPEQAIAERYAVLGKEREAVFPIEFRTRVKINGEFLKVKVSGFMARAANRKIQRMM